MSFENSMRSFAFVPSFLLLFLVFVLLREGMAQEAAPRRVVSLAPSVTETIFALGADDQLVGICTFCDFPQEVERIKRVGSYSTPNVEAIIAAAPDVVIGVPPNSPEAIAALRRAGLKVIIVEVDTIAQIESAISTIAHEVRRDVAGAQLLKAMQEKMAAIQLRLDEAPRRRVLMVVGQNPLIAVGNGIFLNELITRAHGENIAAVAGQQWPYLSLEFVVAKMPEVIIDGSMGSEVKEEIQQLSIWRKFPELPAVREGRLYGRQPDMFLRPGPRLAEGFEQIAHFIHPERFQ